MFPLLVHGLLNVPSKPFLSICSVLGSVLSSGWGCGAAGTQAHEPSSASQTARSQLGFGISKGLSYLCVYLKAQKTQ